MDFSARDRNERFFRPFALRGLWVERAVGGRSGGRSAKLGPGILLELSGVFIVNFVHNSNQFIINVIQYRKRYSRH